MITQQKAEFSGETVRVHKGCSAWRFGYEILRCAQYDKVWGTKRLSVCHAERSAAQSKHLYMLSSHLGLLYQKDQ